MQDEYTYRSSHAGYQGSAYWSDGDNMPWCYGGHQDLVTSPTWGVNFVSGWHVGWYRPTYEFFGGYWNCDYGY